MALTDKRIFEKRKISKRKPTKKKKKKFPDLDGDGKVTRKDILIGRGVIKKKKVAKKKKRR